ncbi:MAG: preprotein translocase subunit SecA [Synergistetes bacterium]|nr:preprotein translocase subunit SecA [Synergistota bacterium]MCX8127606.1 preprotein translocase subunit SecA [Synergistota bacterium]MDW8191477.1 preprotein translocase subunit SecA [Synergistota bacterium]
MVLGVFKKVLGLDPNERELKRLGKIVTRINELEPVMEKLSDEELARKTVEFKERLSQGAKLDDLLIETFAVVREVSKRTIGLRHFDVQLMGGIVLHEGKIAEMKTGEGKTLVATLPVYLNALLGRGVHVVTVNDYLAKRDTEWMGPIYKFLGLSVAYLYNGMPFDERKRAYQADITYGTNSEFGFDYLRDNMVYSLDDAVQRGHYYAIVDEVDCILIDEARTPLIISGPSEDDPSIYYKVNNIVKFLKPGDDFEVNEKERNVVLTEKGIEKAEKLLGVKSLYEDLNSELAHRLIQALRAHYLFKRDVDYVVKDGEVIIVDEFTGRLMFGRRYSDGLHQAIEAKEGLRVRSETQTLATITIQNYFRMYEKLAGMTGTAATEAEEFKEIYKLDVVVIPTHKPMIRIDYPDVIYRTEREKFNAVVDEIEELYKVGRPVLVGTTSIEKSEKLSKLLRARGIPHQVLNAKYHEKEAQIVAQAGRVGAVTIATNMAGRGTDILLGGNPDFLAKEELKRMGKDPSEVSSEEWRKLYEKWKKVTDEEHKKVVELGGLHIIGTERHEARRIDNQLRGRAGRQGDPGSSRFYLSLEDDLLRLFGSDRISSLMEKLGMKEGEAIEHPWLTKAIEAAQKKVESMHFEARKYLLAYDDVMNKQREVIYKERKYVLENLQLKEHLFKMVEDVIDLLLDAYVGEEIRPEERDVKGFIHKLKGLFPFSVDITEEEVLEGRREDIKVKILSKAKEFYEDKERRVGPDVMRQLEKLVMLHVIDTRWKEHLLALDHLRQGIGLRAYGQKDPLLEYQFEAFELFKELIARIKEEIITYLFRVEIVPHRERQERVFRDHLPASSPKKKKRRKG